MGNYDEKYEKMVKLGCQNIEDSQYWAKYWIVSLVTPYISNQGG